MRNARRRTGWHRILEGVIVISAIMIFSFFLMRSYPGNQPHLKSTENTQSDFSNSTIHVSENIKKYNWNKPPFYFTVTPTYLNKNYFEIAQHKELYRSAAIKYLPSHTFHKLWKSIEQNYSEDTKLNIFHNLSEGKEVAELLPPERELYAELSLDSRGGTALLPRFLWYGHDNQFHFWISQVFSKNARSLYDGVLIWSKVWEAMKWTIAVQLPAFIIFFGLGIGWGIFNKLSRSKIVGAVKKLIFGLYAMPLFALAMLVLLLSQYILPDHIWSVSPLGKGDMTLWDVFSTHLKFLILPWICIVLHQFVYVAIQTESTLGREMNRRYILAARSRGSSEKEALLKHALPNAATPLITIAILLLPALVSGSIVIETIFNIPGIGRLFLDSLFQGDWGITLVLIFISSVIGYISLWVGDVWYYYRGKFNRAYA